MREVKIDSQSFEAIRTGNFFYVDKTPFIREWWKAGDDVTLITRPRRFGKTLNMDMLKCFFSLDYAGRSDLFEGLDIWNNEEFRKLQGTYPVISLSFADIKLNNYEEARKSIILTLQSTIAEFSDLWKDDSSVKDEGSFRSMNINSSDAVVCKSLQQLSKYLEQYYQKKVLIFLDEYDTPLQEAYVNGYWDKMVAFIRSLFNSTFKSNLSLKRGLLTGITRVSKESIFSDLNNLKVITTTSSRYETCFGFTQDEVDQALDEYHLSDQKDMVKQWYDGFTFGNVQNIYNPWSILQFLDNGGEYAPYWANTSSNALISYELRTADTSIKSQMEDLMNGGSVETKIDEEIIFSQLDTDPETIWSLFLSSGYLKVVSKRYNAEDLEYVYTLSLTNLEVKLMFRNLISQWFAKVRTEYSAFMEALIGGNVEDVQDYLEDVLLNTVSSFDISNQETEDPRPESFYHGLVLGMIAQERKYHITSNRESGRGRYDVMMKPLEKSLPGIIIEFKLFDLRREKTLEETADRALKQIEEKKYDTELIQEGIPADKILHYGMGFSGKNVIVKLG